MNNDYKAIILISIPILVVGIFILSNGASSFGIIVLLFACALLVAAGVIYAKDKKISEAQEELKELVKKRKKLAQDLQKINHSYMLGIPDLTKEQFDIRFINQSIVYSEDPISALASQVPPGTPSIAEFCLNMEVMLNMLLDELNLSEEKKNEIYEFFLNTLIHDVSEETIKEIAKAFSTFLPPQFYFLNDKINYELECLGLIVQYGDDCKDEIILSKANDMLKSKGYKAE